MVQATKDGIHPCDGWIERQLDTTSDIDMSSGRQLGDGCLVLKLEAGRAHELLARPNRVLRKARQKYC